MFASGARLIIGMDEVGRGALAGPVAVGVCAISVADDFPEGLRDSKLISAQRRVALDPLVRAWGACAVGEASAAEIDELGITRCLGLAGHRALVALHELGRTPETGLVFAIGYAFRGHVSVYHMQHWERTYPSMPCSLSIYYLAPLLDMSCFQLLRWRYKARKSAGYRRP